MTSAKPPQSPRWPCKQVQLITFLRIVPFVLPLQHMLHEISLEDRLALDKTLHLTPLQVQNPLLAETSTATSAAAQTANLPTAVSIVEPITQPETVPTTVGQGNLLKPQPWTPI